MDDIYTHLKEIISCTRGALGIFIKSEFAKKVILRRASKFVGTSIAESFIVNNKCSRTNFSLQKSSFIISIFRFVKLCFLSSSSFEMLCPSFMKSRVVISIKSCNALTIFLSSAPLIGSLFRSCNNFANVALTFPISAISKSSRNVLFVML